MAQRSKYRIWLALALFLAAMTACQESPQNTPTASAAARQFEEFTEETLAQYQGKVVMLNFWATWCPPCLRELPDMEAIYRKYRDQGVVILAVNAAESSEVITAFVDKLDLTLPILRDSQHKAMDRYGIRILPTTLFLNQQGEIVASKLGVLDQDAMAAQIEQLLN